MIEVEDVSIKYLNHYVVVGTPPKDKLSELATEVLQLPYDHPIYIQSLQPGGVLYREKQKFLDEVSSKKNQFYAHYLLSLALFKEENTYELK